MASSSALPTIHQLLEQVSLLLQRGSRTEAETISMALQCLELKGQIEQTKASVVEERMKQLVCKDEIAHLKKVTAPRCSGTYSMVATPGTLAPRPRSKACISTAPATEGASSISLRAKRNGMFFDQEASADVARVTSRHWLGE